VNRVLINGEAVDTVAVTDRGLHYGDGVYETIGIQNGKLQHWDRHQQRLIVGCFRLKLPIPDIQILEREIDSIAKDQTCAVIKIIITRGQGGRGYKSPEKTITTRIVACYPYPEYPADYWEQGVKIRLCQTPLGMNPALAGIKHCNRLEQILARNEWQETDIPEGLMLDSQQNVIEGTMSNIFISRNGGLLTPAITHCGVEGVMRGVVLDASRDQQIPQAVDTITVEDVLNADEVFLTNSVIGIWPVRQFEEQRYTKGPITQMLMEHLSINK
jgi:4-amino-4-deoxychorismate lyase